MREIGTRRAQIGALSAQTRAAFLDTLAAGGGWTFIPTRVGDVRARVPRTGSRP